MTNEILRFKPDQVIELIKQGKMEVLSTPDRAKEILGKDFLGVEAIRTLEDKLKGVGVEVSFVTDGLPQFSYTEEDLQAAKIMGEMLVLRPEEMIRDGIKQPITLIEFRELFQKDPLGKLQSIYRKDTNKYKPDWYKTHHFATDPAEVQLGWSLVKKEVLNGSANQSWDDQEQPLQQYAEALKLKGAKHISIRRRTATEAIFDTLLYYINTEERLLSNIGDCGETLTDDGNMIVSLIFRSDGLALYGIKLENSNPYIGVCPIRPVETKIADDKSSIEKAQQIFDKDFFGPKQVEKTFGIKLDLHDISDIPFSQQELERARKLNQFLILRVDISPDGKPLTMQKMEQLSQDKFKKEKKGRVLLNTKFFTEAWYIDSKKFFKKDLPRAGWALVSKDVIPESIDKSYSQQTGILARYLADSLTGNISARRRYFPEISEFNPSELDSLQGVSPGRE